MPRLFEAKPADAQAFRAEMAAQFPTARFGARMDLSREVGLKFEEALAGGSEEAIQKVLTANPYLIQYAIEKSGHHGIWVFPKQMIRPPAAGFSKGMIPDYLVVTTSSVGYFWYIVELKRADVVFSNRAGDGFSGHGNKAIAQCHAYLAHFANYIDCVRTDIRVGDLIQPEGAVLLIGRAAAESGAQRRCRSEFDRANPNLSVVSYDRILGGLRHDLGTTSAS